jgi:hypothetical protein
MNPLPCASVLHELFLYDPESGILTNRKSRSGRGGIKPAGGEAGTLSKRGYRRVMVNYKLAYVHRVIWVMVHGQAPKDFIDHINGVKNDNRLVNLRECSGGDNRRNIGKLSNNTSGFKGVSKRRTKKKPWVASAYVNGCTFTIGTFDTPEEAHAAYCEFAVRTHGQFANLG